MRKKKTLLQMESDQLQVQEPEGINTNTKQDEIDHETECPRCP